MSKYGDLARQSSHSPVDDPNIGKKQPSNHATMQPSNKPMMQPSNQATKQPPNRESITSISGEVKEPTNDGGYVETIRLAIKEVAKETTSYRLHEKEKECLEDMLYELRHQKTKSNENEIMRIALNFIINDYQNNGDNSIVVKTLRHMRS